MTLIGFGRLLIALASFALTFTATSALAQSGFYYPTPSWDQTLRCSSTENCSRFVLAMGGDGVLDRETGLVWEKSPSGQGNWLSALVYCNVKTAGNRNGWRLPSIQELASLLDPAATGPGLALPVGHPFVGIQQSDPFFYWSITSTMANGNVSGASAWVVEFATGNQFD